jgi:peptide/nickel transport system substrate-binding protein
MDDEKKGLDTMQIVFPRIPSFFQKGKARSVLIALSLASMLILAACGGEGAQVSSSHSKKGGTLVIGVRADDASLDNLISSSFVSSSIYDSLFKYDEHNNIQPDLVASYAYASPTALDLTLRTGIQFQDGTPFNAAAVVFNLKRYQSYKAGTWYSDVSRIKDVVAINDTKVRIILQSPFSPILALLAKTWGAGGMISPTAIKKYGSSLGNDPINAGTGPFSFVEWVKGDHLLLKANPHYWRKDADGVPLPYLQGIEIRVITNPTVMYNNLKANQIQVATVISPSDVPDAQSNPNITYRWTPALGWHDLELNETVPPLNNVHVRRAIAYAINRQQLLTTVFKGIGGVTQGPLPPALWAYDKSYVGIGYDLKQAKAELALSGLSNVKFNLLSIAGNPIATQDAELIQAQLQAVNIAVNIQQENPAAASADELVGHYQGYLTEFTTSINDPDSLMYNEFDTVGKWNHERYSNPQVDALLSQARTITDRTQRTALYQQAQKLIVQDVAFVFLVDDVVQQVTTTQVKNFFFSSLGIPYFDSVYLAQ